MRSNLYSIFFYTGQVKLIVIIFLCLAASSYIGVQIPLVISNLFAKIDGSNFKTYLIFPAALFVFEYINRLIYQATVNKFIQKVMERVRDITYRSFLNSHQIVKEGELNNKKFEVTQGEVLARVMSDTDAIRELISSGSLSIIIDSVFIISTLVSFMKIHAQLGVILIFSEILAVGLLIYGGKWMAKMFLLARVANGNMSRVIANLCGGFNELYYTPHHQYARKRGHVVFDDFLKIQLRANVWDASYYSLAESLFPLLLTLLVLVAPWVEIKEMVIIALIVDLIQRSIGPIKSVTGKVSGLGRAYSGIKRVLEFVQEMSFYTPKSLSSEEKPLCNGKLEEMDLNISSFSYPKKNEEEKRGFQLKNIKLKGRVGELIGIVGPSGHGKSTLLKILSFDIVPKAFKLDLKFGHQTVVLDFNATEEEVIKYRQLISLVTQDSHIFSESLLFNISLDKKLTQEDPSFVHFWELVTKHLPYLAEFDLHPMKEINPKSLSLGQKQLISALRALYHHRPIVLFDEVSSGLDSFLEESLRKLIKLLQKKSLTIVVSHRIETLIDANKIIVIKDGVIEGVGEHQDLLNNSATYLEFISELK